MIAKMKASNFCCSFCGKSKDEVSAIMAGAPPATSGAPRRLAGKNAFICSECVQHYYRKLTAPDLPTSPVIGLK
jgi:ClpX C4-type zinc finger